MSNCEVFNLSALEVELHQVREVLRCVLHTILFNRSLGQVKPVDVDSELFDITYVHCGDPEVVARLEARIDEACAAFERKPQEVAQLVLAFYEPRRRQVGWFGKGDERLFWEKWVVNFCIVQSDVFAQDHHSLAYTNARSVRQAQRQAALEALLGEVITALNQRRAHIPPVVSASPCSFPWEVSTSGGSRLALGLGSVKRLLLQSAPPPVLS
ncbi:ATG101 [Scenedesmus sp. PABB004]|nr:ATG101 [Scenedesmus sp. PABB004]